MRILDDEREVLAAEVGAAIAQLPPGPARDGYQQLLDQLSLGEVAGEPVTLLERLVEIGLESGRIRKLHGPHAEMAATRAFQRAPRGAALRETVGAANEALKALQGAGLREVTFALRDPGAFSLELDTDRCRATLHVDRHGVRIQNLEVTG